MSLCRLGTVTVEGQTKEAEDEPISITPSHRRRHPTSPVPHHSIPLTASPQGTSVPDEVTGQDDEGPGGPAGPEGERSGRPPLGVAAERLPGVIHGETGAGRKGAVGAGDECPSSEDERDAEDGDGRPGGQEGHGGEARPYCGTGGAGLRGKHNRRRAGSKRGIRETGDRFLTQNKGERRRIVAKEGGRGVGVCKDRKRDS